MIVIPYIHKGKKVYDNEQLCYEAFLLMNIERTSDRLSENYSYKNDGKSTHPTKRQII